MTRNNAAWCYRGELFLWEPYICFTKKKKNGDSVCIKILVRFITNSNYNTRGFYNNILTFFKTLALDSSPDGEEVLKLVSHFFSTVVYTRQRLCMFRPANNIQHNIPQQNKDRH